jgi:hypothetical protein
MATHADSGEYLQTPKYRNRRSRVWRVHTKRLGQCRQVWQVPAKRFGKCRRVWRVRSKWFGKCWRVWQDLQVCEYASTRESAHDNVCRFFAQKTYFICIQQSSLHSPNSPNSPNSTNSPILHNACQTRLVRVPIF